MYLVGVLHKVTHPPFKSIIYVSTAQFPRAGRVSAKGGGEDMTLATGVLGDDIVRGEKEGGSEDDPFNPNKCFEGLEVHAPYFFVWVFGWN